MIAEPVYFMRARNSGAMMLQDTGGVEGGWPKGPEVDTHHTAVNRPENFGCLHKTLVLSTGERWPWSWSGWFPAGRTPSLWEGWGQLRVGKCSQRPRSHSALHPPPGVDVRAIFLMEKMVTEKVWGFLVDFLGFFFWKPANFVLDTLWKTCYL